MNKDTIFCKETFTRGYGIPHTFEKEKPYYVDSVDRNNDYWLRIKKEQRGPYNASLRVSFEDFKKYFIDIRKHNLNELLK